MIIHHPSHAHAKSCKITKEKENTKEKKDRQTKELIITENNLSWHKLNKLGTEMNSVSCTHTYELNLKNTNF